MRPPLSIYAVTALVALAAPAISLAADAGNGSKVFATQCGECHSMREGKDKKGPSLFGVYGRKAAQREGFAYSDAMRASGLTWTPENLAAYIANPKKVVPGGKMKFDGLLDASQRDDLVAFMATPAK